MKLIAPHHIIAIGASAGGMEEINTFFDHTPTDGVSYVIIQHLSPVFKSRMVELLARHSKLVVREAEDKMLLLCNEVYLIPHDKFMTIVQGRFYLSDKESMPGPHLTINTFFISLAVDSGEKAIAVILSGLGSDGTEGAKIIKAEGGMVIARDPATAEFSSMPATAIASGVVDLILEPALMPQAIEDYINKKNTLFPSSAGDEKLVDAIIDLIKEQLPLDFTEYKRATLHRRIKRRTEYNNCHSLREYFDFLKAHSAEVEALAQDFLISVTSFFRDAEAFEFIGNHVIPGAIENINKSDELKLWVAGCATGEEAYSLAILIHEGMKKQDKDIGVKIFATDIDTVALATASKGIYSSAIAKTMSAERLNTYFIKEGNNYRVSPEIRRMLIFAQHDVSKNPPYCNMDFISCRNLLIYIVPALQKKIYLMLLFGLKVNGHLFLGSSENPMPILPHLEVVNKKWKIYKNKEIKRSIYFDGFALPQMADVKERNLTISQADIKQNIYNTLTEAVSNRLVNNAGQLAVCIDENNSVVRTYGDTTRYLLQKNFTSNIAELLPRSLIAPYNSSIIKVKKSNKTVTHSEIGIKHKGKLINVSLSVGPLLVKNLDAKLFILLFSEDAKAPSKEEAALFDEKSSYDQYTVILEEELNGLKDKLRATYDQLDASNDNMQSYNEELLSANEEMQSTNEEMQSVNEELHTINTDYQLKNKELLELNDDLNNYFRSNIHGQLFVNRELQLMRFSPATVNLINLLPSDVGRPLSNISTNIKFETIAKDIKKVLADGNIITKEIETNDGMWYQVMTMPYIQEVNNNISGAIITFNDITQLKIMQIELNIKNKRLEHLNADLDNFVHTASHDLLAPLGNIEMSIDVMNKIKDIDPGLNQFLSIINGSVKKFRSLITEIATVAKIDTDMAVMEKVDIEELIKNVEWSLDDKIKLSGAVINRKLEVKAIHFSKKNLRSILFNLVSNSIKFKSDAPPVVNISTSSNGDGVILSVADNGIGMKQEDTDKIFGMYQRLTTTLEGQGIGLYLVKKIVTAAGGKISVETQKGKGCKFTINLNNGL